MESSLDFIFFIRDRQFLSGRWGGAGSFSNRLNSIILNKVKEFTFLTVKSFCNCYQSYTRV